MNLLPSGDRSVWGCCLSPLLPPEWRRGLVNRAVVITLTTARKTIQVPVWELTSPDFGGKLKLTWEEAPIRVASAAAIEFLEDESNHIWLDHPVLPGVVRHHKSLRGIPFLVSTWTALESLQFDTADLAYLLGTYSCLELFQVTRDIQTTLDLVITSREWVQRDQVVSQATFSRDEVFRLAGMRHVAMTGVPRKRLEDARWVAVLAGRAGLHPEGKLTLEEAGAITDVTRERVRQLAAQYDLDHPFRRRWAEPSFLSDMLDDEDASITENAALLRLADEFELGPATTEAVTKIRLADPDRSRAHESLIKGIRQRGWKLSYKSGFARRSDLVDSIALEPLDGLDPDSDIDSLIDEAVLIDDLPLGYLFIQAHSRNPWIVETSLRVLDMVESLTPQQLQLALLRRSRGRQVEPPPPLEVLGQFFARHPAFVVTDNQVHPAKAGLTDETTIEAWICREIRRSGGVLHRSTLLELARNSGRNPASVAIYLNVSSPFVRPVGQGCFALAGAVVNPTEITIAREQARHLVVPTREANWSYSNDGARYTCLIGNNLLDSGLLSVPGRVRRMIGQLRLRVNTRNGIHGHVALSEAVAYGLTPALISLGVTVGDCISITFEIRDAVVRVEILEDGA